jgi:hypothetical protein
VPTREEYAQQPVAQRLGRLARTPDDLAAAIHGMSDAVLSRRPAPVKWCAKEVICHLRDIEELFMLRFHQMLGTEDPVFLVAGEMPPDPERWGVGGRVGMPLSPDRWAQERQYLRNDATVALGAFRNRREESLALLRGLSATQWQRGSRHVTLGRMAFEDWVCLMAAHDDKHLRQLQRALVAPD